MHEQLGDTRSSAFKLATGRMKESPFSEGSLQSLRRKVAATLKDPVSALEVSEGQPFFLHLLAQSLCELGDPDYRILTQGEECYANGMPLGDVEPLPRAPQVYRLRSKSRQLDQTPFEAIMSNYASAELAAEELEAQFRKDERAGMMVATTEGAVRQEYGEGALLVAAVGAIRKPNGDIRPIHDATHGVNLNNSIRIPNKLEVPGPADIVEVMSRAAESGEAGFGICADISQAHRRVKVRKSDWPKLGCKASSGSQVVWLNKVGTFGVSSAAMLWSRLFGCIGRWVIRVMGPRWNLQVIFVDDLHMLVAGPDKFTVLWMVLTAYLLVGTPFAFHKFRGGPQCEFIGYFLSYDRWSVGLSPKRLAWVIGWIDECEGRNWFVVGRRFSEFLGRLNFVARLLTWVKPFLAPLFAFNAAIHRGTAARIPEMVHLSLLFIRGELKSSSGLQSARQFWVAPREAFRTDAKCEKGRIVLGGWCTRKGLNPLVAPWFYLDIRPNDLPCLFKEGGELEWASTSAELLASFAALVAFGHLDAPLPGAQDCLQVAVYGGTDNRSMPAVQTKGLSNKVAAVRSADVHASSSGRSTSGCALTGDRETRTNGPMQSRMEILENFQKCTGLNLTSP